MLMHNIEAFDTILGLYITHNDQPHVDFILKLSMSDHSFTLGLHQLAAKYQTSRSYLDLQAYACNTAFTGQKHWKACRCKSTT